MMVLQETYTISFHLKFRTQSSCRHIKTNGVVNADLSNYFGELMVLYKFSKLGSDKWTKNCKKVYSLIEEHTNGKTLTSANCLGIMTNARSTKESIELFMEYFVRDMTGFLGQMGYPTEKFEIEIKLKD